MRHLRNTLAAPMEKVIRNEKEAPDNVSCSVPSTSAAASDVGDAAALAESSRGEEGTNGQGNSRVVVADASREQTSRGEPSC